VLAAFTQRDQMTFQPPGAMVNRRYATRKFSLEAVSALPGWIVKETLPFEEMRIKTRPGLCKNEQSDMKNKSMKTSSQQQLIPNECGIVLMRHNANSLNVCQSSGASRTYIQHLHALPYIYTAFRSLEIGSDLLCIILEKNKRS